jgi:formate hydrogenlyase subunit 4
MTAWILPLTAWLLAPLMPGVINRVKAVFAGRKGPPLLQLYFDLFKLLRKGSVYSRSTTWVARWAPMVILGCLLLTTLILPWGGLPAPISFAGDFLLFVYLLGTARFATVLGALDTGSAFEGMGSSREVQFAALAEPSLFLGFLVLVLHTGGLGLAGITSGISTEAWSTSFSLLLMVAFAWFFILLAENSRIPVDDPNTHLELTMIHEVMVLDSSGPDFGFIQYAAALKLWVFGGLLVNLAAPLRFGQFWLQAAVFLGGMLIVGVLVGVTESVMARLRLTKIPTALVASGALSLIALIVKLLEYHP